MTNMPLPPRRRHTSAPSDAGLHPAQVEREQTSTERRFDPDVNDPRPLPIEAGEWQRHVQNVDSRFNALDGTLDRLWKAMGDSQKSSAASLEASRTILESRLEALRTQQQTIYEQHGDGISHALAAASEAVGKVAQLAQQMLDPTTGAINALNARMDGWSKVMWSLLGGVGTVTSAVIVHLASNGGHF